MPYLTRGREREIEKKKREREREITRHRVQNPRGTDRGGDEKRTTPQI